MESDRAIMFQHNYFDLVMVIYLIIFTLIPWLLWKRNLIQRFHHGDFLFCYWCVADLLYQLFQSRLGLEAIRHQNWAHTPSLNNLFDSRRGYHNFHHSFLPTTQPQSSSGREFQPLLSSHRCDGVFGWVRNKRVATPQLIQKRRLRTGDLG